jgi:type VI protein secretion system component VasK
VSTAINLVIHSNYPHGMNNREIEEHVRKYLDEIVKSGSDDNVVIQCYPLIALGQYELSKRQNNRITKISICISGVSLLIAIIALCISLMGTSSHSSWENAQIKELKAIEEKLDNIHSSSKDMVQEMKAMQKSKVRENRTSKQ